MKNRRSNKKYILLSFLHVTSLCLLSYISSEYLCMLLTATYFFTSYLFIYVGKCPFEIAVQFKWKDYIKACRRIYGKKFTIALIGYGSYPVICLICLVDYLFRNV